MGFGIFIFYAAASLGILPFALAVGLLISIFSGFTTRADQVERNKRLYKSRHGSSWRAKYDDDLRTIEDCSRRIDDGAEYARTH